jgi:hypothetical protein
MKHSISKRVPFSKDALMALSAHDAHNTRRRGGCTHVVRSAGALRNMITSEQGQCASTLASKRAPLAEKQPLHQPRLLLSAVHEVTTLAPLTNLRPGGLLPTVFCFMQIYGRNPSPEQ